MTQEINKRITGSKEDYISVLQDLSEVLEDSIWTIRTSEQYDKKQICETLEKMRCLCKCIGDDPRRTPMLMNHLGI